MQNTIRISKTGILLAAVAIVGADSFVLPPILGEVARGLATAPTHIAWAISAFGAATALSSLSVSPLVGRIPPGRVLGGGALLLAFAQVASAVSPYWLWLSASQTLAGLAAGILLPAAYATAAATAPPGRESAHLAVVLTGWAVSLVVMVPPVAIAAYQLGWRAVYALLALVSAVVAAGLVFVLLGVGPEKVWERSLLAALKLPEIFGLLLLTLGYSAAFYGAFTYLGEGIRHAFEGWSAKGAGLS